MTWRGPPNIWQALPGGTGDEEYLAAAGAALREALEDHRPGLVLYDAGVDVHQVGPCCWYCFSVPEGYDERTFSSSHTDESAPPCLFLYPSSWMGAARSTTLAAFDDRGAACWLVQ